ncbi:MAG: sigma-70 family RNA polymerase sigma factor, partial [Butyrivibrio sp.]|nr:sigma-70 family RNA polymerase sigma factor [Butyrivibrio sp.]
MEATMEVESIYMSIYQDDGNELYLVDRVAQSERGGIGSVVGEAVDYEKEELLNHMLLTQLLSELTERERELIQMRYFQNRTQMEVARIMGISQVQVSRLEKKILLRMRHSIA